MLGQAHVYLRFNPGKAPFAEERFRKEAARLYRVLDGQLGREGFVAGDYSIADIAIWPWVSRFEWQEVSLDDYPAVRRWYVEVAGREAVRKGYHVPKFVSEIPMP